MSTEWTIVLQAQKTTKHAKVGINAPVPVTWLPQEPTDDNPIEAGDTVVVICGFANYNVDIGTYWNLHVGAVASDSTARLSQSQKLLNITTNSTSGSGDYFHSATFQTEDFRNNNRTVSLIYKWTMIYGPGSDTSDDWKFLFAFGDPHRESTRG